MFWTNFNNTLWYFLETCLDLMFKLSVGFNCQDHNAGRKTWNKKASWSLMQNIS